MSTPNTIRAFAHRVTFLPLLFAGYALVSITLICTLGVLASCSSATGSSPGSSSAPSATTTLCAGGISAFDCTANADLLTARAAIAAAEVQFGPVATPAQKSAINAAVFAWNSADAAWQLWRQMRQGTPGVMSDAQLAAAIASIKATATALGSVR